MPTPKNNLIITRINEISFVDKGDNPPAGAVILKAAPLSQTGASMANEATPTPEELAKRDEAFAKLQADFAKQAAVLEKMQEDAALTAIVKAMPPGIDASLASDLRTVQKANPEAYTRINAELVKLAKRANAVDALTARVGSVGVPAGVSERLQKAVDANIAKGMTKAAATTAALEADPTLYDEARAQ
jgi:cysteine synthase